jgi:alpha-beta hydrolase superfamily lysophospholipase
MVLAAEIIAVLILGVFAIGYLSSRLLTNPPRVHGVWPADFPLRCPNLEFNSPDGTRLAGLFIPASGRKATVVIVHGLGDCKESYAEHAEFLARNGYSVFLFDLRAHGRSGGKHCTMGYQESKDILAAIHFLCENGWNEGNVYLWGVSLGATACLLAAADDGRVKGVIAESPFLSLEKTVAHHARLFFRLPKFPMVHLMLFLTRLRTGVKASEIDIESALPRLQQVPVLFVGGMADRRMPPETITKLCDEKPGKKSLWLVPGARHGEPYSLAREQYEEEVLRFLSKTTSPDRR